jgi:hypothetical protein
MLSALLATAHLVCRKESSALLHGVAICEANYQTFLQYFVLSLQTIFNPLTAILFTVDFFLLCLNVSTVVL